MKSTFLKSFATRVARSLLKYDEPETPHFWEYYNRCSFVADKAASLSPSPPSVLDIGGATGKLLPKFGLTNVTIIDMLKGADIIGDGGRLPIKDRSFDLVTAIDVFEHLPRNHRIAVFREMLRVAKTMVIVIAPQNSALNILAEQIVLKFVQHDWLLDHARHGLVDFEEFEKHIATSTTYRAETVELDNLMNWAAMFLSGGKNVSDIYQELLPLENSAAFRRKAVTVYLR